MLEVKELVSSYRIWKIISRGQLPPEHAAEACAEQQPKYATQWRRVKSAVASGKRLSDVMQHMNMWPPEAVSAVRAGEASRELDKVFHQLMEMTDEAEKIRVHARKRLVGPIMYTLIGQILFFAFFIKLYPALTERAEVRTGLIGTMDAIQSFVVLLSGPAAMGVVALAVFIFLLNWLPDTKDKFLALMELIPSWGTGQRYIATANWSRVFSLLDCTNTLQDEESIKIATSVLEPRHQVPFKRLLAEYGRLGSLSDAANPEGWSRADVRRQWPIIFTSALSAGAAAGGTGEILADVAGGLMEEGRVRVDEALDKFNLFGMVVAGLSIGSVMLLMAMSSIAQTMATL